MPAANYRVEVRKSAFGHEWSNDYLLSTSSLTQAATFANALAAMERGFHGDVVLFEWVRTSTLAVGDRQFIHTPINLHGQSDTGGGTNLLPLFNTIRVDLGTASSDPARKYYRQPILETQQSNGTLDPTLATAISTDVASAIIGGTPIPVVTTKGNAVVSVSVFSQVQMRQLFRRRRKKVTS